VERRKGNSQRGGICVGILGGPETWWGRKGGRNRKETRGGVLGSGVLFGEKGALPQGEGCARQDAECAPGIFNELKKGEKIG